MSLTKKILLWMNTVVFEVLLFLNINTTIYASQINNGSTFENAIPLEFNITDKQIYGDNTVKYYTFTIPSSGRIDLTFDADLKRAGYLLYDENREYIGGYSTSYNELTGILDFKTETELITGKYYLVTDPLSNCQVELTINFTSANESFKETIQSKNNSFDLADNIELGEVYRGHLALNDENDVYRFIIKEAGKYDLNYILESNSKYDIRKFAIYDFNKNLIESFQTTHSGSYRKNIELEAGEYFFVASSFADDGNYSFSICNHKHNYLVSDFYWKDGQNCNIVFKCSLCKEYKEEKCIITHEIKTQPTCTKKGSSLYTATFDIYNNQKEYTDIPALGHDYKDKVVKASTLKDGYEYKECSRCKKRIGKNSIARIKSIILKYTKVVYNGKEYKPSVMVKDSKGKTISSSNYSITYKNNKNVGKAIVIINFKGNYSETIKRYFVINPKKTKIEKIIAKVKGLKILWSKQLSQSSGYQIQYATDSGFTKNNKIVTISNNKLTSKTITKLSGNKVYYVRVRTYKKINGDAYYSSWSSKVNVKTKR